MVMPNSTTCSEAAQDVLQDLGGQNAEVIKAPEVARFSALRNARVVLAAEAYYRLMSEGSVASWNARDSHMFKTLLAIMAERGEGAKAVVWAHNSHIGDASATQMGRRGEINIGQLAREHFGDEAVLIGFGTDRGTVTAATEWGGSVETKQVQSALVGSVGQLFRDAEPDRLLLDLRNADPDLLAALMPPRNERFIGVQYLPETERSSHYAEASLAEQFDTYVWLEHTSAVEPLTATYLARLPQSHPFALPLENVAKRSFGSPWR